MLSPSSPAAVEMKALLDAAGTMIVATDLSGTVQIFSNAAERLLGWAAAEVIGHHTPALWHDPKEVEARAAELSQELNRAVSPDFEVFVAKPRDDVDERRVWTIIRKDGSSFPGQLLVSAIRDAAGAITGYVGTIQDLTAQFRAEQERDRLFNLSVDMLGIIGSDGRFEQINPAFSRTMGWAEQEVIGRPFLAFVHPDDRPATLRELEKLSAGSSTPHLENRYRRNDGSWRWLSWAVTLEPDGALYASARDITDRKQTEETLRRNQQVLAIALNWASDAVIATDAAGYVTYVNPVAEQMTGWTQQEAIGRAIGDVFQGIYEETRRPATIAVDNALATGAVHRPAGRLRLISRDGRAWSTAVSAVPTRGETDNVTGVVLVFREIGERTLDRQLPGPNARLECRIEKRTAALADSEKRLRRGNRILESLVEDTPLEQTLDLIIRATEDEDPTSLCSILLLDETGTRLLLGAAPSLPEFYNRAIHGIAIGEDVGSCGAAVFRCHRVIAEDLRVHRGWTNYRELAEKAGLRSCWSEPILAGNGRVLGTFAIYHREARVPHREDIERIEWAAAFARLAIEHKQAQEQLAASRARYAALSRVSPVGIALFDAAGRCVEVNRRWSEMTGIAPEKALGDGWHAANHPEDRARVTEQWISAVRTGQSCSSEHRLQPRNGRATWVVCQVEKVLNQEGEVTGYVRTLTDFSQQKQAEQALHRALEELRAANAQIEKERASLTDRVAERTTELRAANAKLVEASQAKSEFLAAMSHELRTPLNGIQGMNELLLATELTERQRQLVEVSSASGTLLVQLISDILDISKIEAGKLELDPRECDIEALIYDVADVLLHTAQKKKLTLRCSASPDVCVVGICDDNRLRQVLVNLVANAIKFTSCGGVTISARRLTQPDGSARFRFAVVDSGIGIPEQRLDRLFKPFSQVDSSTTRRFGGTGLGLSICQQLIELMDGEIGVESQVGVGSTFWIEIPIQIVRDGAASRRSQSPVLGARVLAVGDLGRTRQQVRECLTNWGCCTLEVASVAEGLDALRRAQLAGTPFAVVLVACHLVNSKSYVALQNMAENSGSDVIGLGSPPDAFSADHLHSLGMRDMLRDPVRPVALLDAIESALWSDSKGCALARGEVVMLRAPAATLDGHILVAEDNETNQLYVIGLLKLLGCTCDVVSNGDEALAAVMRQRYDLVLMDCQMPEVDGFAASFEIRRRESAGQLLGRLPIVALTANALKGDRERCLAAGMDDYLTKPVEKDQMHEVLRKYLGMPSRKGPERMDSGSSGPKNNCYESLAAR